KKVIRLSDRKGRKLAKKDKVLDEGNLFMRWGEPLAVYDSAKASEAAGQMRNYLHTKGFFLGNTSYDTDTTGKRIKVTYNIIEKEPYVIDSLIFTSSDSNIVALYEAA